jgi:uncharacterized protein (TIGR03067 family)
MTIQKFNTEYRQWILLSVALLVLFSCTAPRRSEKTDFPLNGSWKVVRQELNGKEFPADLFNNQTLVLHDSVYTLTAESVDKGVVRYANGRMDIYGKEGVNAGKHFTAIYKPEGGQLSICYNLTGNGYPADFSTSAGPLLFLSVFQRIKD